jgi:uncharacterized SAM-binding protein YcdF (DUF218 family)
MDLVCEVKSQPGEGRADLLHKKPALRSTLAGCALSLLIVILAFALLAPILKDVANYLVVNDRLQPADVIFLLNSEVNTRPFRAAELYRQGLAPAIVIARSESPAIVKLGLVPNDTDISVAVMEKQGVPPAKIIVLPYPGGVTSTFDEAATLKKYIETSHAGKIILVTSVFHTRRARWIFEKALAGLPVRLEMAAVPYATFDQSNWWKSESGLITFNNEFIKLLYYFVKYR